MLRAVASLLFVSLLLAGCSPSPLTGPLTGYSSMRRVGADMEGARRNQAEGYEAKARQRVSNLYQTAMQGVSDTYFEDAGHLRTLERKRGRVLSFRITSGPTYKGSEEGLFFRVAVTRERGKTVEEVTVGPGWHGAGFRGRSLKYADRIKDVQVVE